MRAKNSRTKLENVLEDILTPASKSASGLGSPLNNIAKSLTCAVAKMNWQEVNLLLCELASKGDHPSSLVAHHASNIKLIHIQSNIEFCIRRATQWLKRTAIVISKVPDFMIWFHS